jgi:hypothetical protein
MDAAKKYVVSSTLERVDWNAELVRGDLGDAVRQLKREPGKGRWVQGSKLQRSRSAWQVHVQGPRRTLSAALGVGAAPLHQMGEPYEHAPARAWHSAAAAAEYPAHS